MIIFRHLKTINPVIYKRKSNKNNVLETLRNFTSANSIENDKNQISDLLEEAKNFQMTNGGRVPTLDKISSYHWQEIAQLQTKSARRKYFEYLWLTEVRKKNKQLKQDLNQPENPEITLEESRYFIYRHFPDSKMNNFYHHNLIRSMLFGQKLIIDCSYEDKMTQRECSSTAEQLKRVFSTNREHLDPFDIHFCHVNPCGKVITGLSRRIPTLFNPDFPINLHEGSYLEKFGQYKKKFVYLTPDSQNLLEFSHDDIYIVGALTDRTNCSPFSLYKAKDERLRTARLPLDGFRIKGGKEKDLAINQVVSILLDLKDSVNVRDSLEKHVPRRKLIEEEVCETNPSLKNFQKLRLISETWGPYKMKKNFERDMRKANRKKSRHTIDVEVLNKVNDIFLNKNIE